MGMEGYEVEAEINGFCDLEYKKEEGCVISVGNASYTIVYQGREVSDKGHTKDHQHQDETNHPTKMLKNGVGMKVERLAWDPDGQREAVVQQVSYRKNLMDGKQFHPHVVGRQVLPEQGYCPSSFFQIYARS